MQDEHLKDAPEDLDRAINSVLNTADRTDDSDLAWSESEDEGIGDDFDSEGEIELASQDGGADHEDWELAERGVVLERDSAGHFCY